jgi:anti-anti-sigma factor
LRHHPSTHYEIEIEVGRQSAAYVLRVRGELDLAAVPEVRTRFGELTSNGVRNIVLDLREVTFMDSMGIGLLIELSNQTSTDGLGFSVLPGDGQVRSVLRLTGMDDRIPIVDGPGPAN